MISYFDITGNCLLDIMLMVIAGISRNRLSNFQYTRAAGPVYTETLRRKTGWRKGVAYGFYNR
jgi:hypothetical protein